MSKIFTIGHSTNTVEKFTEYLMIHQVNTIVDVRSVPYSRFANQFNKEQLAGYLKRVNILYIPMGNSLGAKYEDKKFLFEDGKVNFTKVVASDQFQKGIYRLQTGIEKGYKIALMCSEKNPIECHRFSLVSNYLYKEGYDINHIIGKKFFNHKLLQDKLLDYFKEYQKVSTDINRIINFRFKQLSLFDTENVNLNTLYLQLNKLVGYNSIKTKKEMI